VDLPQHSASLRMRGEPQVKDDSGRAASANHRSGLQNGSKLRAAPWRWRTPASRARSPLRFAIIQTIAEGFAFALLAAAAILVYSGGYRIITGLKPQLEQIEEILRIPDLSFLAIRRTPAAPVVQRRFATVDIAANVYTGPAAGNPIVSVLSPGAQVQELETRGVWIHVRLAGADGRQSTIEGWVASQFLKAPDPER
jgi:hypothetical protein